MRYFSFILLFVFLTVPTFADDDPDIKQVARFGRGTAYTLAWRPDGEVLAVGSSTGVWFFDEDFNELGRLAEDILVNSLEWSPDGKRLMTANNQYPYDDCQLIIWNISEDLIEHSQDNTRNDCARSIDWSTDGRLIAIGISDQWEIETNIIILSADTYEAITEYPNIGIYVAFSPDSQQLAINHNNQVNPLTILNPIDGDIAYEIYDSAVFGKVVWSYDGSHISTGCDPEGNDTFDNQWGSCVWDIEAKKWLNTGLLLDLHWHPSEDHYVTTGRAGYGMTPPSSIIRYYDDLSENFVMDIEDMYYGETLFGHVWHPSAQYLLAITISGQIVKINTVETTIDVQKVLFQPPSHIVSWIPKSQSLMSITGIWNNLSQVNIWHMQQTLSTNHIIVDNIDLIQWIENSQDFIAHSWSEFRYYIASVYDSQTLEEPQLLFHFVEQTAIPIISWSKDTSRVAYIESDSLIITNEVFVDKADTIRINLHVDSIRQIEWSPDDSMIATVGNISDSHFVIDIWDASSGEKISSIQRSWMKHLSRFVWSPDNSILLVIGERLTGGGAISRTLSLYKVSRDYDQYTTGYDWYEDTSSMNANIMNASWSPDSQMIAVSFQDAVKILDVNSGIILGEVPIDSINTLDWHDNGNYLAGGASDGTIYVWDVSALMEE